MKKVLLIDVDSKIPNLALMNISAFHKAKGDIVSFDIKNPDIIYASVIFSKNKHDVDGLQLFFPNAEIYIGGSGIAYNWLPSEMQKIMPDYDLYPNMQYSLGFTTRGCIRKCQFCIVPEKEGKYQRWMHISEFHDSRFKAVQLLDNNWYADKDWFFENSNWIIDNGLSVIENGLDIRILDREIAEQLFKIKWAGTLHFAWDNVSDENSVIDGLKLLEEVGFNLRNQIQIYVLTDLNTTIEEDLYRCNTLKELNTNPFVMKYQQIDSKYPRSLNGKRANALQRWANNKKVFWTTDFIDYTRKRHGKDYKKMITEEKTVNEFGGMAT